MNFVFHLGHPAHFHLFKNIISSLKSKGHKIAILIKKKDILEELLRNAGLEYYNILPKGRTDSKFGIAKGMIESDFKIFRFCLSFKPDILIGTSYAISHVGKILNIPSINVNEDDAAVVPLYSKLSYPWASVILSPKVCVNGKWEKKSIKYEGFHELAYLHPNQFTPNKEVVKKYFNPEEKYFLIRFAKLTAHHDDGIKGINDVVASNLVKLLAPFGKIYITSERKLSAEFEPFRININPLDIHHVMAFAHFYIGDSQTMAAESGVLGTPFIRYNDFVGKLSYLNEIEQKYKLGFGIKPENENLLYEKIKDFLSQPNLKQIYSQRRQVMLSDKIDVSKFFIWLIESFPQSIDEFKENSNIQFNFK